MRGILESLEIVCQMCSINTWDRIPARINLTDYASMSMVNSGCLLPIYKFTISDLKSFRKDGIVNSQTQKEGMKKESFHFPQIKRDDMGSLIHLVSSAENFPVIWYRYKKSFLHAGWERHHKLIKCALLYNYSLPCIYLPSISNKFGEKGRPPPKPKQRNGFKKANA